MYETLPYDPNKERRNFDGSLVAAHQHLYKLPFSSHILLNHSLALQVISLE